MIYQTDRFLEFSSQRKGQAVDEKAVSEIRALDTLRADKQKAVELLMQDIFIADEENNSGEIIISLKRPLANFTCSGSFEPILINTPHLSVELVSAPSGMPACTIKAGTGVNTNFNIHLRSDDLNELLPVGEYVFDYHARCETQVENELLDNEAI